ncbi:DUF309 domain-containing protein [Paenibacillus nanensis]|uniref:DUF309 domain-containing protein n=1 Tax=Paenibacillus nanensis TaxID=393251 RepID=A0A3A1UZ77_9BACL|nr:DUF309 domain-containing protein [Paenibacillus nanensis]RIX53574.1 DUF309 domain-containing protein [Paenibacillus nanensis]
MGYPDAYIAYLVEFHATRDFFECHELLEEYWKAHPDDGNSSLWVGLIQTAVGQYHERRGNLRGAAMMYEQALAKLSASDLERFGIDKKSLIRQLGERIKVAGGGKRNYADMELQLTDPALKARCAALCKERGLLWGASSPQDNEWIVHRHLKRDRTDVIAAREAALRAKSEGRRR